MDIWSFVPLFLFAIAVATYFFVSKPRVSFSLSQPGIKRGMSLATMCLVVLGFVRILVVTLNSPIVGYANNYDFVRQEACLGLWQRYANRDKKAPHSEAPVNDLILDRDIQPDLCFASVDNIFAGTVAALHATGDQVDFRGIAIARTVFLLAAVALLLALIKEPWLRTALALVFFLVFGDIAYMSYFNTLYAEFSVVLGTFLAIGLMTTLWQADKTPHIRIFAAAMGALIWLGLTKPQYSPLASLFSLCCAALVFYRWGKKQAVAFAVVAVAIPLVFSSLTSGDPDHLSYRRAINLATKTNAILGAILPAASDPHAALINVGLPETCAEGIGKNWFTPGVQEFHPCPALISSSRLSLVPLVWTDPMAFVRPLHHAVHNARPMLLTYLGNLEDERTQDSAWYQFIRITSLSTPLDALPQRAFDTLMYLSFAFGLVGIMMSATHLRRVRPLKDPMGANMASTAWFLTGLGGLTTFYALATSVLGDGFSEIAKHAVIVGMGLVFQIVALCIGGFALLFANERAVASFASPPGGVV